MTKFSVLEIPPITLPKVKPLKLLGYIISPSKIVYEKFVFLLPLFCYNVSKIIGDGMVDANNSAMASNVTMSNDTNINTTNTDNSSAVTQNIAINADFSGLHDAQELENAIDNLSNKALQYAYKTI